MKKAFVICPVRLADDATREKLENYALQLESNGYTVHLPHRDTDQAQSGLDICLQNAHAIQVADEVHIFYLGTSTGIHFDMGVTFALDVLLGGAKKIVVVENEAYGDGESFPRMLDEWVALRVPEFYPGETQEKVVKSKLIFDKLDGAFIIPEGQVSEFMSDSETLKGKDFEDKYKDFKVSGESIDVFVQNKNCKSLA